MQVQVDGDVVVFRAGFGAEHVEYDVTYVEPDFNEAMTLTCRYKKEADTLAKTLTESGKVADGATVEVRPRRVTEPLAHALHNVGAIMNNIVDSLGVSKRDVNVWLSGKGNFRYDVATIKPYKANRKDAWRPTYEHEIKDYMVRKWGAVFTEGQEADDAMGIAQCAVPFGQSVICTNDKDLDMIPGLHYNFTKDERYVVDDQTATWVFWRQLLTGDSTDNIMGVPGIGEKKSYELLADVWDDEEAMRQVVWGLYVQGYEWAAWPAMVENGRLIWIRRKEGELWEPH